MINLDSLHALRIVMHFDQTAKNRTHKTKTPLSYVRMAFSILSVELQAVRILDCQFRICQAREYLRFLDTHSRDRVGRRPELSCGFGHYSLLKLRKLDLYCQVTDKEKGPPC